MVGLGINIPHKIFLSFRALLQRLYMVGKGLKYRMGSLHLRD